MGREDQYGTITHYSVYSRAEKGSEAERAGLNLDLSFIKEKYYSQKEIDIFLVQNKVFKGPFKIVDYGQTRSCSYFRIELFTLPGGIPIFGDIKLNDMYPLIISGKVVKDMLHANLTFESFGCALYLVEFKV